jgi:nicotinamide phosphoribosyltransferase
MVYSNWTPRSNKYAPTGCDKVVSFGQQATFRWLHDMFQRDFFDRPKAEVCGEMKEEMEMYLGTTYDVSHFEALHDLGYLPINVKSITEGELVPMRVAMLTIHNTLPEFFWLTNYLETILSTMLWLPMTSATTARQYKKILTHYANETNPEGNFIVAFQGHDFSMRGMGGLNAVTLSGLGHGTSFLGSDSLPAIYGARAYYDAVGPVLHSVNATEHSVMCAGTGFYIKDQEGEWEHYGNAELSVFRRLITEVYPSGIVSIVSDTWDLWKVLIEYMVELKEEILARSGADVNKVVIRPDSGDPADILCGMNTSENHEIDVEHPSYKGVIELLWDVFGGTESSTGYKVLNEKVGAIYGDSITVDRTIDICERLMSKGFASTNTVLGIGSYTYQMKTRDTFGFAMKATYSEVEMNYDSMMRARENGGIYTSSIEGCEIFKDPITDDGVKKSARGLLQVVKDENGELVMNDQVSWKEENTGELIPIYTDGEFLNETTYADIRSRIDNELAENGVELKTV